MRTKLRFGAIFLSAALAAPWSPPAAANPRPLAQDQDPQNAGSDGIKPHGHHNPFGPAFPDLAEKQKKRMLQENLDKSRKDSEELASLAHEFQKELRQQVEGPLSPDMALELERIEKLAKKIRGELEGY